MSDDLKPCPFCGSTELRVERNPTRPLWEVECYACWGVMTSATSQSNAEHDWNRRWPEDALRARAEAAEQRAEAAEAALAQARAEGEAAGRAAERTLGDHDARNVLWLSGRSLKHTNITSPAGRRALERFNSLPQPGWSETPQRIDALVALVRESHEIHSEWHGRLISRDEAEAYVRGAHVGAAGGAR